MEIDRQGVGKVEREKKEHSGEPFHGSADEKRSRAYDESADVATIFQEDVKLRFSRISQ